MKKLFTLFALLVAIVTGAWADTETFSMEKKWTSNSVTQNGITVTFSESESGKPQTGFFKFVKGQTMTISSTVGNITALAFTSDSEKYGKANGTSVNTGTLTGAGTANISWSGDASEVIFTNDASKGGDWRVASITVTYSSGPATQPVITTQPKNVTYSIGSTDYPSFSIVATASAGELKYQWQYSFDGNSFTAIPDAMVSSAATATLSGAEAFTVLQALMGGSIPEGKYYFNCVLTDDNASVTSNTATLTVKEAATPGTLSAISESATWNFSSITWNGESYKNANNDFEFTDENASTEWIYSDIDGLTFASDFNAGALAFKGQYPIRSNSKKLAQNGTLHFNTTVAGTIKVSFSDTGSKIPEGGAVERYLNVNGKNTEFFTKRDGSSSDAKTAEVNVAAGDVYITGMGADGETPQAICITSIEFTASAEPAPVADKPTITTQPQNATYIIGSTDYPSMSVEATASAGELKYQWHITIPSVGDIAIPGAEASTLSLATYASSPEFAPYLSHVGSYSIYCNVADDNGNVDSNTATLTVSEAAPGPELDEQTDVTGDMTWDWSKFGTTEIKFLDDGTTTPKKPSTPPTADEEFVLSNVIAYGWCESIGADFGDAQALKVACEYPVRDGSYFQGPILRFNTTVPGTVKITCSSTGSKDNHNRDVIIGGVVAGQVTNTTMADFTAEVATGEVLIKGVSHGAGADADAQYLRISKIVFTTGTPTGVNGVAEAETEAPANVKIIKNGQLFIGKFNIAGQQVK